MKFRTGNMKPLAVVCLALTLVFQIIRAAECDGVPPTLNVQYKEQKIFSFGYPGHYGNNMDCVWTFEAEDNTTEDFGIQIATIELDLDPDYEATTVGHCDSDYLELLEGTPSNLGQRVGIWCGNDRKSLTSSSRTLTLKFHSNDNHMGKGFVIEYALIKLAPSKCQPGNVTQIYVGQAPVYAGFTVNNNESRCTWRIESIDNNGVIDSGSALVVEAFSIPRIWCRDGKVVLYDGPSTSSPKVVHWCNGGEAFTVVFLSSNYATLTFVFEGSQQFQSDTIDLKLYTRSLTFPQICSGSVMPEIQVNENPVYFYLPFIDVKGNTCSVHISQKTENTFLRIDVMSVDGHLPTCESDVITVTRALAYKDQVEKSCNRRQYPMYLPKVAAAIINSTERVLVRAVSADPICSGVSFANLATTSLLMVDTVPKGFTHGAPTHNCISKYLIRTENENLAVALWLEWAGPQEKEEYYTESDVCPGDFVNVYDGTNESSPLLFSTCHKTDQSDLFVRKRIIGDSNSMLVLFNTDDAADSGFVRLKYYAVPRNKDCSKPQEILVMTHVQELTSPNYPQFYPLDYDCTYKLTAKNPKDVIVIEAVDLEFSHRCEDTIQIYNGDTGGFPNDYYSHICGHDKNKQFISNQHRAVIRFRPDAAGLAGRWKLKIYSQGTRAAGRSQFRDGELIFVWLTFVVGFLLVKL